MLIKIIKFWLLLLFFIGCNQSASAYVNPGQPTGFVNDYAGLLSDSQRVEIEGKLLSFEQETNNEIAVVTINSLDGDTIENFAVKLFADWGIGKKVNDNGVLILVAKNDRLMRIEVGYGLEGLLTDAQSFSIINNIMQPAFREDDFYGGIDRAVDQIIVTIGGTALSLTSVENQSNSYPIESFFGLGVFIFIFLISLLKHSKSWWLGGVIGAFIGVVIGLVQSSILLGAVLMIILAVAGLVLDLIVSKHYQNSKDKKFITGWFHRGGRGGRGGGFGSGGFGGGRSGGGGASGRW